MKKIKMIEAALLCALIISPAVSVGRFYRGCKNVEENVVRLHVIANSDSASDQKIKLLVRNAVLNNGAEIFGESSSAEEALEKLKLKTDEIKKTADETLIGCGASYRSEAVVGEEYFNTRSYGDITLPAGRYRAVRIILGSGEGHNWWCVMFPPLCLPAAEKDVPVDAYLDKSGVNVVRSDQGYEIRFKIVEVFEKMRNKVKDQ
ncbi:MAG: stage II sporulation protein R [Clostridiales bacterium]|nr:stage II sporulation protein R [Clostridiales bacterium]